MPKLKNKIIAITRSEQDAKEFLQLVREQGGRAIALPVIEIVPRGPEAVEEFLDKLCKKKHYYCVFMSQQAVNLLFNHAQDKITPLLKYTTVIAVGPKTKQSLEERGIKVGMVLEKKFSSIGLVDLMSGIEPSGKRIIIPRSAASSDFATKALIRLGMDVDEILLYGVRTRAIEPIWEEFCELLSEKRVDAIIFTSASNVSSFFEIMEKLSKGRLLLVLDNVTKVVSIGPFTTKALRDRGIIRCFEAEEHTVRGTLQVAEQIL